MWDTFAYVSVLWFSALQEITKTRYIVKVSHTCCMMIWNLFIVTDYNIYIYICIKHVCTHLHVHSLDTSSNVCGYKVNYEDLCWNMYLDLYTSKPTDCIRGKQTYLPRSVPYKMPVAKNWAKWRIPMEWPKLWWFFFPYIHFSLLKSMNWLMSINLTQRLDRGKV